MNDTKPLLFTLTAEEETGKAFMLMNYLRKEKELTKTQWKKKGLLFHQNKLAEEEIAELD